MNHIARSRRAHAWLLFGACLCVGSLLSLKLGQDAFWDTKNYHLYNAWALLNARNLHDLAPAGMQSYFNPLADLPYFVLATGPLSHWPRVLGALQGWWFGALFYVVLRISFRLAEFQQRKVGAIDVLAALIGVSGSMAVSQAGSTTNEIPLAVFVLLGFYLLMPLFRTPRALHSLRRALFAGLCCGLAAGLKPTAVVYPPALGFALLFAPGSTGENWKLAATFAAGTAIAFLLSYGWWGLHLYHLTGNPVFPLFNQVFRSDLIPPVGGTDDRFRPRNLAQWLFYPVYWITPTQGMVTEPEFSDARYALAMLSVVALLISAGFAKWCVKRVDERPQSPVLRLLVLFTVVSYVLWMALFSILRYAVPIEALTGLLMLVAVQVTGLEQRQESTWRNVTMVVLFALVAATTHYPEWGRTTFGKRVFAISTGEVEHGSLVLVGGAPSAYIAPFFPHAQDIDFVGLSSLTQISNGHRLWDITREKIAEQQGPIYITLRADDKPDIDLLQGMLAGHRLGSCRHIWSNLDPTRPGNEAVDGLRLCRVVRG